MRTLVLDARENRDTDTEQALAGLWRLRLQQLLDTDAAVVDQIRQLLDEHLAPALAPEERAAVRSIVMRAQARDHSRVYMAGQDIHLNEK
ncbi:hypothetical protein GT354_45865 [Streptomyces sp. SID3343]|nr:hypothetical protein [Streptomyces sp. SID3343]